MPSFHPLHAFLGFCKPLVGLWLWAHVAWAWAQPVPQVIAHPDVKLSALQSAQLRALFSLHVKTWPDGTPTTLVVLPDQDDNHRLFAKQTLRVLPYVLRDNWDRKVFTGTARAPVVVTTWKDMVDKVASTPGALGYLDVNFGNAHGKVKFIPLD